jgi:hypothetical protein
MTSGYDLSNKVPFRLMKGRLGVYDKLANAGGSAVEGVQDQSLRLH